MKKNTTRVVDEVGQDVEEVQAAGLLESDVVTHEGILVEKLNAFDELLAIQKLSAVAARSGYQIGLYNGLALGRSLLTGMEPEYFEDKG